MRKIREFDAQASGWFSKFLSVDVDGTSQPLYKLFRVAALSSVTVALIALLLVIFGYRNYGEWGDFIGGLLNPILTFLTFMGLLLTIILQQKELRATRDELQRSANALDSQLDALKKQNFESTFFSFAHLLQAIVDSTDIHGAKGKVSKGRDAFRYYYDSLRSASAPNDAIEAYENVFKKHRNDLAPYFRVLANIFDFLDKSDVNNKELYSKLIRDQLSESEATLLALHGLYLSSESDIKEMINKHGLLKNIMRDGNSENQIRNSYGSSAFL